MSRNANRRNKSRKQEHVRIPILWVAVGIFAVGFAIFTFVIRPATSGGAISNIGPNDYVSQFGEDAAHILVDVRTPTEFESGHIPGAINIPVDSLANELDQLPADQDIVVYCQSGNRSVRASRILSDAGYGSIFDLGGIIQWRAAGLPVQ